MPVIFNATPGGSNLVSPQVQQQAFLAGAGVGKGLRERKENQAFTEGVTSINNAQSIQREMDANPNGPWAPGFDPIESSIRDVLQMAQSEGLGQEQVATLMGYADQIRQDQRRAQGRNAVIGRITELAQLDPALGGAMQGLLAVAQDPTVSSDELVETMENTMRDWARYQDDREQRTAEWMSATQQLGSLRRGELDSIIPQTITEYDRLTGEARQVPNPVREQLAATLIEQIARTGVSRIPFYNTRNGEGLDAMERGGMPSPLDMGAQAGLDGSSAPAPLGAGGPQAPPGGGEPSGAVDSPVKAVSPVTGKEGPLAKARRAEDERRADVEFKARANQSKPWAKVSEETKAEFVSAGVEQALALEGQGMKRKEAFAAVLAAAVEKSPFFVQGEPGGKDAPDPDFVQDLIDALEMVDDGLLVNVQTLRSLYRQAPFEPATAWESLRALPSGKGAEGMKRLRTRGIGTE